MEISVVAQGRGKQADDRGISRNEREELIRRFAALPAEQFPQISRYAAELTSGTGHERFDFTLNLIVGSLS